MRVVQTPITFGLSHLEQVVAEIPVPVPSGLIMWLPSCVICRNITCFSLQLSFFCLSGNSHGGSVDWRQRCYAQNSIVGHIQQIRTQGRTLSSHQKWLPFCRVHLKCQMCITTPARLNSFSSCIVSRHSGTQQSVSKASTVTVNIAELNAFLTFITSNIIFSRAGVFLLSYEGSFNPVSYTHLFVLSSVCGSEGRTFDAYL